VKAMVGTRVVKGGEVLSYSVSLGLDREHLHWHGGSSAERAAVLAPAFRGFLENM
jgi:hypothetical protein